jgi:hypothetical protein
MVRELFQMARQKKACIIFFDEVDAIGGARFDDGQGGDNEVQRTMLEIVNQVRCGPVSCLPLNRRQEMFRHPCENLPVGKIVRVRVRTK